MDLARSRREAPQQAPDIYELQHIGNVLELMDSGLLENHGSEVDEIDQSPQGVRLRPWENDNDLAIIDCGQRLETIFGQPGFCFAQRQDDCGMYRHRPFLF